MSVFKTEETQTEGVSQNTEQTTNESQPQDSYVQKLVEVKGENWKDWQDDRSFSFCDGDNLLSQHASF